MGSASSASNSTIEDLREYVDAFRASSNRSRYALYVVIITSVLIGIATLNAHALGWPLRRIVAWYGTPLAEQPFFGRDTTVIKIAREEYLKQFVGRGVMPASPIPGVSMDVNDLGVIGGIALILLTAVMLFCLLREHENLQLALFKVRQLCTDDGPAHTRGDSRANLLYHALAMGQVLASPPTLARWRKRAVLRHFALIYFTPAAVQLWVLWNNWQTREIARDYNANVWLALGVQAGIFLLILSISAYALLTSRAMAKRWRRAFYRVNPARRMAPEPHMRQWMKLTLKSKSPSRRDTIRPRVITSIVDALTVVDLRNRGTVPVECSVDVKAERIHGSEAEEMVEALFAEGEKKASDWCARHGHATFDVLVSFDPRLSQYVPLANGPPNARWVVSGDWTFFYVPAELEADVPAAVGARPHPDSPASA
jgi:hypothetical protein